MSVKTAFEHRLRSYRNPVYIVYILAGVLLFLLGRLIVASGVGNLEIYLFRFFNSLPGFLTPLFILISFFGTIGFVFVATIVAMIRKHYSHALKFLIAGVSVWLIVKWLKLFSYRARPSEILPGVQLRETLDSTIGYPSGHAAVATALGLIAYLYTPKRMHPFITSVIILVYLSRLYLGMHLPIDILGGFAVGLVVASTLNYIFGDTQGKFIPTSKIKTKLSVLKLNIKHVERANVDARGSTPFFVVLDKKPDIFVKVVDTSNNVADWLFKLTRKVIYRRLEDESPFLTPKRQLEHEAYVAGLALSNNVRTPKIRGIFHVKEDMWAMAQEMIPGESLDKVGIDKINKKLLIKIWEQVKLLHDANIIHRDLRAANIFLDKDNEPWIIDFGFSEASVPSRTFYRDTVELIASLSVFVDPKLVATTAREVIGEQELVDALPYVDYASLSGATTKLLKERKGRLDEIIRAIHTVVTGKQEVKPIKIKRIDIKALLYIAMIGLALYVFIPQFADLKNSIGSLKSANIGYVWLAFFLSVSTYFAAAAVYKFISILPISYFRTLLITVATSFTNRLLPASTGGIATNIRYLQNYGYSTTGASSLTALNNLVGLMGHLAILFVVAGLSHTSLKSIVVIPVSNSVIFIAGLVIASCIIAIFVIDSLRRKAKKIYKSVRSDLTKLFEHPDRFFFALFSAMTITTLYSMCLYTSALALGIDLTVLQAFFVFTIGIAAASVKPTPGGIGGAEAGLVAGFVSVGIPAEVGLSIALLFRLLTFWLPIIPGFIAFHFSTKKHYL